MGSYHLAEPYFIEVILTRSPLNLIKGQSGFWVLRLFANVCFYWLDRILYTVYKNVSSKLSLAFFGLFIQLNSSK